MVYFLVRSKVEDYAKWKSATKKLEDFLSETSLTTAAWNHPEHRFYSLPESLTPKKQKNTNRKAVSE